MLDAPGRKGNENPYGSRVLRSVRDGQKLSGKVIWRRERDSNPRYGCPYTHFPGVRLQPLGHPSGAGRGPAVGTGLSWAMAHVGSVRFWRGCITEDAVSARGRWLALGTVHERLRIASLLRAPAAQQPLSPATCRLPPECLVTSGFRGAGGRRASGQLRRHG